MNVKELKEKLNEFPDDAIILVRGYEWGYWEPILENIVSVKIVMNVHNTNYGGPHAIITEYNEINYRDRPLIDGVFIQGEDK